MSEPTKFVVAPEPFFRFLPNGQVEARTRTKVLLIGLPAYRVLLELNEPRTFDEVLARVETTLTRSELADIVLQLEERALLTRVVAEDVPTSEDEDQGFVKLFRPGTFDDPAVVGRVAEQLAAGRAVVIPDVFVEDVAEHVYEDLENNMRWRALEETEFFAHFRFRNADLDRYFPPSIAELKGLFGTHSAKRLMATLSGRNCNGALEFGASWYMPGDHTHPHDDNWSHRSIVGIWNFSKNWNPVWGGSLFWAPSATHITPQFNCLTLFNVTSESVHQVCIVSPFAQRKRLTVNAWWTNESTPPQIGRERKGPDDGIYPPAYGSGHVSLTAGIVAV